MMLDRFLKLLWLNSFLDRALHPQLTDMARDLKA
jgi:hypothetical protein